MALEIIIGFFRTSTMSITADTNDIHLQFLVLEYYKDSWGMMTELERETVLEEAHMYRQGLIDEQEINRLLAEQKWASTQYSTLGMATIDPRLLMLKPQPIASSSKMPEVLELHQQCRTMASWARALFKIHIGASEAKAWAVAPGMKLMLDIVKDVNHIAHITAEAFKNKSISTSIRLQHN